ncbi:MAG TPA: chemotaxis response regulator protein-glutamate methylesterase [Bacillota bacterium]|jgi:two-component system chemotaxis response regulator CheB|nr:chemotaxis response regulator protein-glutamate methylesterase [Bacillota bacterium]
MAQISVLVADDSAFMRKVVSDLIAADPELVVVGTARNGSDCIQKARSIRPDVITLDVEMPVMGGLEALPTLTTELGIPVVMLSSLTQAGADVTIRALSLGAVDFVPKPSGAISLDIAAVRDELVRKIKAAAAISAGLVRTLARDLRTPALGPAPVSMPTTPTTPTRPSTARAAARKVVVIGTSTGGPRALTQVIPWLPPNLPAAVLIVQHMPAGFTRSLAERLNDLSRIRVTEAQGGETIAEGEALIAAGGRHMLVAADGALVLDDSPPMHGVRPAVDMTMNSAVDVFGRRIVGVIMTGMGSDGADAMARVKLAGGKTIAEHESSCVVYGMPRSVVERGIADKVVPLPEIADEIVNAVLSV